MNKACQVILLSGMIAFNLMGCGENMMGSEPEGRAGSTQSQAQAANIQLERERASLEEAFQEARTQLDVFSYIGDREQCKMSAETANAYAEALAALPEVVYSEEMEQTGQLVAALADVANDGIPILMTAYRSSNYLDYRYDNEIDDMILYSEKIEGEPVNIWHVKDGKAERILFTNAADLSTSRMNIGNICGKRGICVSLGRMMGNGDTGGELYYSVSNGQVVQEHELIHYTASYDEESGICYGECLPCEGARNVTENGMEYAWADRLLAYGWYLQESDSDFKSLCLTVVDGKKQKNPYEEPEWRHHVESECDIGHWGDTTSVRVEMTDAAEMIEDLHKYVDAIDFQER